MRFSSGNQWATSAKMTEIIRYLVLVLVIVMHRYDVTLIAHGAVINQCRYCYCLQTRGNT